MSAEAHLIKSSCWSSNCKKELKQHDSLMSYYLILLHIHQSASWKYVFLDFFFLDTCCFKFKFYVKILFVGATATYKEVLILLVSDVYLQP